LRSNGKNKQDHIIPISSIPLGYDLGLEKGWKILESPMYFPTPDKTGLDVTDISSILDMTSVRGLIKHHQKMNIPLEEFIKFRVFCGTKELQRGVNGFDIDLNNKCIYTYNADYTQSHRIFVIINSMAINNMATEITNFDKT